MEGPFRVLMPLFLIIMWVLFVVLYRQGVIDNFYLVLLGLAHIIGLLITINFVHIFTFSYALTSLVFSVAIIIYYQPSIMAASVALMMALYGVRLCYFSYTRLSAESYGDIRASVKAADKEMPSFVKVIIWISTSWNYTFYSFSAFFVATRFSNTDLTGWPSFLIFGLVLMVVGLFLETLADAQKQAFKSHNPSFCNVGLFTTCRHPNYLGEILFVLGVFVAGVSYYQNAYEWVAALLTPLYLLILMIVQARSGDSKQLKKYGDDPAYQSYVKAVPSLLPNIKRHP